MRVEDIFSEEPGQEDMDTPDTQEDLFRYLSGDNVKPEDLPDARDRKLYKKWLATNGLG